VVPVGVFVDQAQETVKEIARVCALQVLQFHGNEPPAYLHSFPQRIIKTISVKDENSLQTMASYQSLVSAYLLDTYVKGKVGGTGRVFNWNLAILAKKFGPIILAGGITPDNVQEAIKKVKPYGIDVCSGVEKSPGKKDPRKLEILVRKVREINF
jgi:phosphoribosylanthranilate isomerase